MLLTITLDGNAADGPATDLSWLLAKHPGHAQSFDLPFGTAWVFYPEADDTRCTAALLVDIDPVGLTRPKAGEHPLAPYVSDRPYVASSFLAVALGRVFASARRGTCREQPELPSRPRDLRVRLPVVRGTPELARRLFEPLGYAVEATPLEDADGATGRHIALELARRGLLSDVLAHLYVLVPVLDGDKHYWVGEDEIEKLVAHGAGWLAEHPEKERIVARYLKRMRGLVRGALARLEGDGDEGADPRAEVVVEDRGRDDEAPLERALTLDEARRAAVRERLEALGVGSVLDLGCGEGKLVKELCKGAFTRIAGCDVSAGALALAEERLAGLPQRRREVVTLFQGSLVYRDKRFAGWDAITLVEVIEHVEPERLAALEEVVFGAARPRHVIVTTPNREYNVRFSALASGRLRHHDHRFEWTRAELAAWSEGVAARRGYRAAFYPIGPLDAELGAPTQMVVFSS